LAGVTRHPNLFIIGAAKCGTTSAYEWLKGHPQVFMSPAKEPRYFAPDLHSGSQHDLLHPHDGDRYLALFADAGDEKWLGEASVRYINSKQAPRLIHEFAPEARIVAMIRNPVDMLHSLHNQRVSEGSEPLVDFAAALAADDDRAAGRRLPPGRSAARAVYRPRARFAELLTPWIELFGRDAVHVIVFEDLVDDPAAVLRRLLGFLEIDADYQPGSYAARNRSHAPRLRLMRGLTRLAPVHHRRACHARHRPALPAQPAQSARGDASAGG
jgi:hypothetical protein